MSQCGRPLTWKAHTLFWNLYQLYKIYEFPIAAVTKCHKLSGLRQQKFIFKFCSSEVHHQFQWAKIKVLAGMHFFVEVLEENLFPYFFHFLETAYISWLAAPSFIFKASASGSDFSHVAISLTCFHWHTVPWITVRKDAPLLRIHMIRLTHLDNAG